MSGSSSREAGSGAAKLSTASGAPFVIIMGDCCGHSGNICKYNNRNICNYNSGNICKYNEKLNVF
jgi:hypothetical protein